METENIHTLGGWFMNQFRGKLEKGAKVYYEGYSFLITEFERNSILRFEVKAEPSSEGDTED